MKKPIVTFISIAFVLSAFLFGGVYAYTQAKKTEVIRIENDVWVVQEQEHGNMKFPEIISFTYELKKPLHVKKGELALMHNLLSDGKEKPFFIVKRDEKNRKTYETGESKGETAYVDRNAFYQTMISFEEKKGTFTFMVNTEEKYEKIKQFLTSEKEMKEIHEYLRNLEK